MPRKVITTAEFITALFQFTERNIYFATLPNLRSDPNEPGERHISTREVAAVESFIAKWDRKGRGTFFCVSTINGKRNKANAIEIAGLHTDQDFKNIDAPADKVREVMDALRCRATARVHSGGGFHSYWMFKEPLLLTPDNVDRVEAVLRQLADLVAGDLAVCEVARLMRLPGTHNSKEDSWRPVTVERIDGPRYELDDLEEWLAETAPVLRRRLVSHPSSAAVQREGASAPDNPFLAAALQLGFRPPVDIEQRLAQMSYGGSGDSSIHLTQLSVSASLLTAGRSLPEVVNILLAATKSAAGEMGTRWNWGREERAIWRMCETWLAKHPAIEPAPQLELPATEPGPVRLAATSAAPDNVADLGAARAAKRKPRKAKGDTPLHITVAEALLAVLEQRSERVMFTERGAYRYRDGLWCLETDPAMQGWLDTEIEACARGLSLDSSSRLVNEARKWIIRNPDLRRESVPWDAHGMVPTASGLVHPYTGKLTPCQPEQYVTWRTICRYEPEADCPLWLQMVADVFADRPEDVKQHYMNLLQEMAGAGLIDAKSKALSKALILWGGQDSGKSGLIEVISGLYGEDRNTTGLAALDQTHGTMGFTKRRPWVLYEAFEQNVWHLSAVVKTIISGEPININIKNGPILSQRYRAPILWATNHAPQFKEATKAIVQRMVILQCRQTFDSDNPTGVALKAQQWGFESPNALVVATEMEGVLAWAVEGLRRCLARGYFDVPAESIEVGHQVRLDSNLAAEFMESCVDFDPDAMISVPDFCAAHSSWWLEHKGEDRRCPSNDSIGKALRSLGDLRISADKNDLRDKGHRYYAGVSLNEEGRRHWKNAVTSDAFLFQGKKASTTDPGGEPFKTIPRNWAAKPAVLAMRAAQAKSVTLSGLTLKTSVGSRVTPEPRVTPGKQVSQDVSPSVIDDEGANPPDDVFFR